VARRRVLHRFVAVFWLLGAVHTLGAGTDGFFALAAVVVLPPLVLLGTRWRSRIEVAPGGSVAVATSHSAPG
jgi:hypothetical protein